MYPVEQVFGKRKLIDTKRLPMQLAVYATSTPYNPTEFPRLQRIEDQIRAAHPELPVSSELDGATIIGTIYVRETTREAAAAKYPQMADLLLPDAIQTLEILSHEMFPKGIDVLAIDGTSFQPRGSRWVPMEQVPDAVFGRVLPTDEPPVLIQCKPCPEQGNAIDCGIFMCLNAASYGITKFEDTRLAQQRDIRTRFTADIINQDLKYSTSDCIIRQDVLDQVHEAWRGESSHPDAKSLIRLRQRGDDNCDDLSYYTNDVCLNLFLELVINIATDTAHTYENAQTYDNIHTYSHKHTLA